MHEDGKHTENDIEGYKKSAIYQKSLEMIKMNAREMEYNRRSPNRYGHIKAKVAITSKPKRKTPNGSQVKYGSNIPSI